MKTEKKHNSTMDSNGRFLLPVSILREWQPVNMEEGFVINRSSDKCLTLYPMKIWKKYQEKLNKLNAFDPKVRQYIRFFTGGATEVKTDSKGRLLIPQHLQEYAKLGKELYITKFNFLVEIWNPEFYDSCNDDFVANNQDFIVQMSNEIYGDGSEFTLS
jgi:MraZ protein